MKASEVLKRYAAGERDFRRTNLRGQSFKRQALSGADFSEADIRGANFSNATLKGANFARAIAGLQKRWILGLASIALASATIAGSTSAVVSTFAAFWSNSTRTIEQNTLFCGVAVLAIFMVLMLIFIQKGSAIVPQIKAWIWTLMITLIGILTGAGSWALAGKQPVAWAVTITWAGGLVVLITLALTLILGLAVGLEWSKRKVIALAQCLIWAVVLAEVFAVARAGVAFAIGSGSDVGRGAGAGALVVGLLAGFIAWRILNGGEDFSLLRKFAVGFAAMGGTTFRGADLTDACFAGATLRGVNLWEAQFAHTEFSGVVELDRARLGSSILSNPAVRNLLVTRDGCQKSYINANLRNVNLNGTSPRDGVDLKEADLKGADLSGATLHYADLRGADLTEALVLGTDFSDAFFTGACLEGWNTDHNTKLDRVDCQYVYLLRNQQERRPSSGDFAPGEFTKLFQEVLSTVDLIFRKGIDWKAFAYSFNQLVLENEGTELSIQSIENKGDGVVVVRVNAPPDADKATLHREFNQTYETAVKALEAKYHAELQAKDDQIVIYRQQSADMLEITRLMANRPINVQAIAEAKTMNNSNDSSQSFKVGGNFNVEATNSVVNLRDISGSVTNTIAQLQQSTNPESAQLAEWLKELQGAIEAEPTLKPEDKAEALEQVETLAKAGEKPEDGALKKLSNTAVKILKGTIATLPDTAKLADACSKLLPLIRGVLGI